MISLQVNHMALATALQIILADLLSVAPLEVPSTTETLAMVAIMISLTLEAASTEEDMAATGLHLMTVTVVEAADMAEETTATTTIPSMDLAMVIPVHTANLPSGIPTITTVKARIMDTTGRPPAPTINQVIANGEPPLTVRITLPTTHSATMSLTTSGVMAGEQAIRDKQQLICVCKSNKIVK